MLGPGKYDEACTRVRGEVGISDGDQGGVILIVIGGNKGSGFSCQTDLRTTLALPDILEGVANEIRKNGV